MCKHFLTDTIGCSICRPASKLAADDNSRRRPAYQYLERPVRSVRDCGTAISAELAARWDTADSEALAERLTLGELYEVMQEDCIGCLYQPQPYDHTCWTRVKLAPAYGWPTRKSFLTDRFMGFYRSAVESAELMDWTREEVTA